MESRSLKILIPFEENDKPILHSNNHKGQKCDICSKVFFHEVDFKTHIKVHNGEKPFQCSFPGCFRKFNRKSNLEYHEKSFHKNNKLKKEDLNKKCIEQKHVVLKILYLEYYFTWHYICIVFLKIK